jgi:hypothetical protein
MRLFESQDLGSNPSDPANHFYLFQEMGKHVPVTQSRGGSLRNCLRAGARPVGDIDMLL